MINLENQEALAATIFPEKWGRSLKLSGLDRLTTQRELRQEAVKHFLTLEALADGGRCENCVFFSDEDEEVRPACSYHSTRANTVYVTADQVCPDWEEI